jgi:DNA-binding transcriptional LysR family regulator
MGSSPNHSQIPVYQSPQSISWPPQSGSDWCHRRGDTKRHGGRERLADHNCMRHALYPYEDGWRFVDRNGAPASVQVSGNLISNSGGTLRTSVLQGVGILLAAGFLIADDLESGRLVRIRPVYRPVEFAMNAVYPHRHHLSAKVRIFIDLLSRHSAEHQR